MLMDSLSEQNQEKILGYLKSEDLIYKLDKVSNIIGRDTNCSIVLNHPSISKQHAKIEYDIQTLNPFLTDLNSIHGTFINNMRLNQNQSIKIKSGDVINFGQSDIKYIYLNYKPKNEIGLNNNNFGYKIKDNKISLVNETEYENASMNHFNGMNLNAYNKLNSLNLNNLDNNEDDDNIKNGINDMNNKEEENIDEELVNSQDNYINNNINNYNNNNNNYNNNSNNNIKNYNNNNNNNNYNNNSNNNIKNSNNNNYKMNQNQNQMTQIIEESNPDMQSNTLLLSSNNFINQKIPKMNMSNQNPSLYQELYNKNNLLEIELKSKNNEIKNLTELYNQLQDNYNKLNAKHNALMIYASDIQKKNDVLELEIQEKNIKMNENNNINNDQDRIEPNINMNKILIEKEAMINHLQEENQLYKKNLEKIKKRII